MKTLLTTVLSALVLLALLVALKFQFEHHLAPKTSGIHGELQHTKLNIVLLGSSHTRQGYDAAALERETGKSAFVVAYDGLDFVSMLPLVRAIVRDSSKRPDVLVVEANRATLSRRPEVEEPRLFFDAPPSVKRELVASYLQTHHTRDGYLDMWTLMANRGSELILSYPFVSRAIDSFSYNGSYINKMMNGMPAQELTQMRVPMTGSNPDIDQLQALRSIFVLVKSAGVKMVLADPPMPASVEAQPGMLPLQSEFQALADTGSVRYYQGADGFPVDDASMFHDSNHLSTAGRELYTKQFAAALQRDGQM